MNELTGHQGQDEYIPDREKAQRQLAVSSDTYQQPRDAKCPTDPFWHQYTCEESDAEMTPGLGLVLAELIDTWVTKFQNVFGEDGRIQDMQLIVAHRALN